MHYRIPTVILIVLTAPALRAQELNSSTPTSSLGGAALSDVLIGAAEQPESLPTAAGLVQERFDNGVVKLERGVALDESGNFINHGPWRHFDEAGNLIVSGNFDHGKMHGDWTRWYRGDRPELLKGKQFAGFEAPLVSFVVFERGVMDGVWVVTDAKNRQLLQIQLEEGQREGPVTFWHANGKKSSEANYRQGMLHGVLVNYDAQGEVASERSFLDGREQIHRVLRYGNKGPVREEQNLLGPQQRVARQDNWWKAELAAYEAQSEPLRHGMFREFHENGRVRHEGEYEEGVEVGRHSWWYPTGQLAIQGEFQHGERHNSWIWNHENGLPKAVGRYEFGHRTGKWMAWTKDGKVDPREVEPEVARSREQKAR